MTCVTDYVPLKQGDTFILNRLDGTKERYRLGTTEVRDADPPVLDIARAWGIILRGKSVGDLVTLPEGDGTFEARIGEIEHA